MLEPFLLTGFYSRISGTCCYIIYYWRCGELATGGMERSRGMARRFAHLYLSSSTGIGIQRSPAGPGMCLSRVIVLIKRSVTWGLFAPWLDDVEAETKLIYVQPKSMTTKPMAAARQRELAEEKAASVWWPPSLVSTLASVLGDGWLTVLVVQDLMGGLDDVYARNCGSALVMCRLMGRFEASSRAWQVSVCCGPLLPRAAPGSRRGRVT